MSSLHSPYSIYFRMFINPDGRRLLPRSRSEVAGALGGIANGLHRAQGLELRVGIKKAKT